MKSLKEQYEAKILRYNFGNVIASASKIYDELPTVEQLEQFLKDTNEKSQFSKFHTEVIVNKSWKLVNL